jgi:hypothetical protein
VPLAGEYRSPNPWSGGADIIVREDKLMALGMGTLVEDPAGFWRLEADKGGYERFRFDVPVAGRMYRLSLSGADLTRIT